MSDCQTKAGNQISLSHSHSLSFTHSRHTEQLLFSCLCSKVTLSLSHSLTLTLSHSLTLTLSHSLSLSHSFNLSFTHSWHAEQLLFSSLCSKVTLTLWRSHSHTLSLSLSHSFNLSFTHSRHAEQVLFSCQGSKVTVYRRKLQWFFLHHPYHPVLWV